MSLVGSSANVVNAGGPGCTVSRNADGSYNVTFGNAAGGVLATLPTATPLTANKADLTYQRRITPATDLSYRYAVTGATNASPIVITVASTAGMVAGHVVLVGEVLGNTAAQGIWTIASVGGTTFQLVGSTGNGAYTSGGFVTGQISPNQQCFNDLTNVSGVLPPAFVAAVTQATAAANLSGALAWQQAYVAYEDLRRQGGG